MAKKSRKKLLIITLSLVALGLTSAAAHTYYRNNRSEKSTGLTPQQEETAERSKESTQDTNTGEDKQATVNKSQQENQAEAQAGSPDFELTLARAEQVYQQNVEVRAFISGATTGACTVTFSGPGTAFSKSSSIVFDGRTYTCGALDAEPGEFSQSGSWDYSLRAASGNKLSNIIQGRVEVKK